MSTSQELFQQSLKAVPGGVHSPVRSFKGLKETPIFFERGDGAFLYDVEKKSYIDFCMSFGPLILGHAHPVLKEALGKALNRGWSFGACEAYSLELAEFLLERLPFVNQIRFTNSGTEAVMAAIRLARGVTGRNKILKFSGCYHGHVDSMLIKAGSGLAGTSSASSLGIPEGVSQDTLICELDSEDAVNQVFAQHPGQIAAVAIEPLPANNGLLPQRQEFLKFLREKTKSEGSLLLFDEVISGFRVAFGGMVEVTGIEPDLVTYGKIIGGGLPVGALAGKKNVMEHLAPLGGVYQAGTLSANPLAMVGGLTTLKELTPIFYKNLEQTTANVVKMFDKFLKEQFTTMSLPHTTGLFWFSPAQDLRQVETIDNHILAENFQKLFSLLLEKGIYLAPNGYEVCFASSAHQKVLGDLEERLWT